MPRTLRALSLLACAWVLLLLGACGALDDRSPTAGGASADPSSAASTHASAHASAPQSLLPTTAASPGHVYVNEARGWSIVVPPGWEVHVNSGGDVALTRDQVIAEILVSLASGLTLEQLQAQKVDDLSAWPGAEVVEAQTVRLPAGEAVIVTMETSHPNSAPGTFVLYVIEEGVRQYVISVRGPQDDGDLLPDAEALAESFVILE